MLGRRTRQDFEELTQNLSQRPIYTALYQPPRKRSRQLNKETRFPRLSAMAPFRKKSLPSKAPGALARRRAPQTAMGKAKLALSLTRRLAAQVETKCALWTVANYDMFAGAYALDITNIAQGDTYATREGNHLNLKRLDVSLALGSYVQSNMAWRILVVQDKSSLSGQVPGPTDFLVASTTNAAYDAEESDRFHILYDKVVQQNASYLNQDMARSHKFTVRNFLNGGKVSYASTVGTSVDKNRLMLFVIADYAQIGGTNTAIGASDDAEFGLNLLAYFTDM